MYTLTRSRHYPPAVTVVGCGGTGGFLAEGLCRMLAPRVRLILVDHDRVEEHNLRRQNFYQGEIGAYKCEALAERLARQYNRPVGWSNTPFGLSYSRYHQPETLRASIIIGCVDNAQAREGIASNVRTGQWWIDAGNGENWGQVLIGNAKGEFMRYAFDPVAEECFALPLPTLQHPELLSPPPAEEARPLSCAELVDAGDQDPTINQAMASIVLQVVRRLFMGTCPWMALYLNLEHGTLNPVFVTPEQVARVTGIRQRQLLRR